MQIFGGLRDTPDRARSSSEPGCWIGDQFFSDDDYVGIELALRLSGQEIDPALARAAKAQREREGLPLPSESMRGMTNKRQRQLAADPGFRQARIMYLGVVAAERERAQKAEMDAERQVNEAEERAKREAHRFARLPAKLERMGAELELGARAIDRDLPSGRFQIGGGDKRSALRDHVEQLHDLAEQLDDLADQLRAKGRG